MEATKLVLTGGRRVSSRDLCLADTIMDPQHPDEGVMVVAQIADGRVHLFRPYPTTADFQYTGGVICYIGVSQWDIAMDEREWILIDHKELR